MSKDTRKVGRPLKPDKTKKSAKIFINMTEDDKIKLMKFAEKENLSLSQVCYKALRESKFL